MRRSLLGRESAEVLIDSNGGAGGPGEKRSGCEETREVSAMMTCARIYWKTQNDGGSHSCLSAKQAENSILDMGRKHILLHEEGEHPVCIQRLQTVGIDDYEGREGATTEGGVDILLDGNIKRNQDRSNTEASVT